MWTDQQSLRCEKEPSHNASVWSETIILMIYIQFVAEVNMSLVNDEVLLADQKRRNLSSISPKSFAF